MIEAIKSIELLQLVPVFGLIVGLISGTLSLLAFLSAKSAKDILETAQTNTINKQFIFEAISEAQKLEVISNAVWSANSELNWDKAYDTDSRQSDSVLQFLVT